MCVGVRTGDECPAGTGAFHTTFFVGPNSAGRFAVYEMPVPFGPRKRDQLGSVAASTATAASTYLVILILCCRISGLKAGAT